MAIFGKTRYGRAPGVAWLAQHDLATLTGSRVFAFRCAPLFTSDDVFRQSVHCYLRKS